MAHFFFAAEPALRGKGEMKLEQSLTQQLEAIVAGEGLELVATEVVGSGPRTILRLVIDAPGGVTLDHCADVSRQTSALLDVEDPIAHRYTLEVTSPGLDRKLYSTTDYARFAGRRVKIRMKPSYRTHRVVVGELVGLDDTTLRIRGDAGTLELPFAEVLETRLEVDWELLMKEGKDQQ